MCIFMWREYLFCQFCSFSFLLAWTTLLKISETVYCYSKYRFGSRIVVVRNTSINIVAGGDPGAMACLTDPLSSRRNWILLNFNNMPIAYDVIWKEQSLQ